MKNCTENLGANKSIASFVLPLGATINMDGTAIYQGVCAIFIANVYGIDLTAGQMLMIVLTGTLASVGTAGVSWCWCYHACTCITDCRSSYGRSCTRCWY